MRKTIFIPILLFFPFSVIAQPKMVTISGFQFGKANVSNISGATNAISGNYNINHFNLKFDALYNNVFVGMDESALVNVLMGTNGNPKNAIYGGLFSCRLGMAFGNKNNSKWGIAGDVAVETLKPRGGASIGDVLLGITVARLQQIGDKIYLFPKLTIGAACVSSGRGGSGAFECTVGYKITDKWGITITPVIRKYDVSTGKGLEPIEIRAKYLQIGVALMN